jgi:hypothetical protein
MAEMVDGNLRMKFLQALRGLSVLPALCPLVVPAAAQSTAGAALPDIHQLMHEVEAHQRQMDKVRENYTYTALQTTETLDSSGHVTKTETEENDDFFVNSHIIERITKKNGKPLAGHDDEKETARVTKLVDKAEKTPPGTPLEGQSVSVSRILEIMDVRNPRRVSFRGRSTIVFDFAGRKDAKTHGLAEDASKKLQGTLWVDEADRQVAHLEVSFTDNFKVVGGLFASVQKGSSFRFDQAPVGAELWLPTGAEAAIQARLLLVKGIRQHFTERDYDFKQFHVDAQQGKSANTTPGSKQ